MEAGEQREEHTLDSEPGPSCPCCWHRREARRKARDSRERTGPRVDGPGLVGKVGVISQFTVHVPGCRGTCGPVTCFPLLAL